MLGGEGLEPVSRGGARANTVLRPGDNQLEAQNRTLLESKNRRARLQLRLQQTVGGLSVAAITYYLASLVGYLAKGAKAFGLKIDPELATAAAIPLLALAVWYGLRRLHRHVRREDGVQDGALAPRARYRTRGV